MYSRHSGCTYTTSTPRGFLLRTAATPPSTAVRIRDARKLSRLKSSVTVEGGFGTKKASADGSATRLPEATDAVLAEAMLVLMVLPVLVTVLLT